MLAELLQPVPQELSGRLRDEYLAAVPGGGDPRRAVNLEPDIALVGDGGLAGVDPHPHADRAACKRGLPVTCRGERVGSPRESDEERVALRVDLESIMRRERVTQHPPMHGESVRVPVSELAQQASRPLDIREEERDSPGRQLAHPPIIRRSGARG